MVVGIGGYDGVLILIPSFPSFLAYSITTPYQRLAQLVIATATVEPSLAWMLHTLILALHQCGRRPVRPSGGFFFRCLSEQILASPAFGCELAAWLYKSLTKTRRQSVCGVGGIEVPNGSVVVWVPDLG